MRDPIEELESFNEGGIPVNPLSPADVRRAGDRLRRRRNVGAAVASVAALAVIATPFALLAGGDDKADGPTPVAPSETAGRWLTEIPDGFPVAVGLGTDPEDGSAPTTGVGEEGGPGPIMLCGEEVWPVEHLDRAWAELFPPAAYRGRELVLFESDTAARGAMDALGARLDACHTETVFSERAGSDQLLLHTRYDDGGLGDQTIRFATYWDQGIDTDAYQLIRVGNAVALTLDSGEGNEETVGGDVARLEKVSANLASEMQVFSGETPAAGDDLTSMLLTEAEVPMGDPSGEGWWVETGTFPGEGTADFLPCLGSPTGLGATQVAMRQFGSGSSTDPDPSWTPGSGVVSMVARFPDASAAQAAYDRFQADLASCRNATFTDPLDRTSIQGPRDIGVDQDGALVAALTFGPAGQETEQWLEVGLALEEDRVAVVSSVKRMHDQVQPGIGDGSPIVLMTGYAAASIEPGTPEVDPGGSTSGPTDPATDNEPLCTADHLEVSVRYLEGATGHLYDELRFTNTSDQTCVVAGQTAITVIGDKASPTNLSAEGPLVGIPPGEFASAVTDHSNPDNYEAADCDVAEPVVWQIEIPGGTGDLLEIEGAGYGKACTALNTVQIQPWQLGSSRE